MILNSQQKQQHQQHHIIWTCSESGGLQLQMSGGQEGSSKRVYIPASAFGRFEVHQATTPSTSEHPVQAVFCTDFGVLIAVIEAILACAGKKTVVGASMIILEWSQEFDWVVLKCRYPGAHTRFPFISPDLSNIDYLRLRCLHGPLPL